MKRGWVQVLRISMKRMIRWALNLIGIGALVVDWIIVWLSNWWLLRLGILIIDEGWVDDETRIGLEICAVVWTLEWLWEAGENGWSYPGIIYLRRSIHISILRAARLSWRVWRKGGNGSRCAWNRRSVMWPVPRIIICLHRLLFRMKRAAGDEFAAIVTPRFIVVASLRDWLISWPGSGKLLRFELRLSLAILMSRSKICIPGVVVVGHALVRIHKIDRVDVIVAKSR